MNILMLIVGVALVILSIGSSFRKVSIGPKSNPGSIRRIQLGPIVLGLFIIALAVK